MFTLYYLFFSLFILVGNSSELAASSDSRSHSEILFYKDVDAHTAIRLCRLSVKEFYKASEQYNLYFTQTHFATLRKAIKEILLRGSNHLALEEVPAVFETFNYPNQEFLKLNYSKLEELMNRNLEKPLTIDEKVSLVMSSCINDTRDNSSDGMISPLECTFAIDSLATSPDTKR